MKCFTSNMFKHLSVSLVTIMMLLSGSALFAVSSMINEKHECSCNDNNNPKSNESLKCNKYCCIISEAKSQNIVSNQPTTINSKEKTCNQNFSYYAPLKDQIIQNTFSKYFSSNIQLKIYISTSVFRI